MTESSQSKASIKAIEADCLPCEPSGQGGADLSGFGFRIGISLALAGQGMIFGLGYNNALQPEGHLMYRQVFVEVALLGPLQEKPRSQAAWSTGLCTVPCFFPL